MKLSIIIPYYNEKNTIKPLLDRIYKQDFPIPIEIIIVDDGSKTPLKNLIQDEISSNRVKVITLPENQGKGIAIRVGLKYTTGNIFVVQDSDLEYFPEDIPKLLLPIINNEVQVVYGTRLKKRPKNMTKSHLIGNIFLTKVTNILYNANLTDMETGYKLFTKEILDKISLNTREFEFEPEITSKIIKQGYRIKEIPIKYKYREHGVAKINIFDGLESLLILLQFRFFPTSKLFRYLFNIYKYHIKNNLNKILKIILKIL